MTDRKSFRRRAAGRAGFTIIEVLVVISVIALMVALLLPTVGMVQESARRVATHSDLRQIDIALRMYRSDHDESIPPVRGGCSTRSSYEVPPELAVLDYLPLRIGLYGVPMVDLFDRYRGRVETEASGTSPNGVRPPDDGRYRYRAAGPMIMNEYSFYETGSRLFIPGDFPSLTDEAGGGYVNDPDDSPVLYAIWSQGPSSSHPKMTNNPGRGPLLERLWMTTPGQPGLIVHAASSPNSPYPDIKSP